MNDIVIETASARYPLVRDSRFPQAVNDIVIETASARYQDAIDRFVPRRSH